MIPHRGTSEVNVEVSETTLHTHQTVPAVQKQEWGQRAQVNPKSQGEQTLQSHLTRCPFIKVADGEFPLLILKIEI